MSTRHRFTLLAFAAIVAAIAAVVPVKDAVRTSPATVGIPTSRG